MAAVDRSALWSSGRDESVEVNQRALIDKVLARYSGEFTVFRELLQNSDDAASKAVEICFESKAYLDRQGKEVPEERKSLDLKENVHQWTFRNNGLVFREEDWSRLKKIAEGNPDEEKIGAFGVGFYSLFSITEEPFVKSGNEWMGFYWKDKKDQLFARRGVLPGSDSMIPDPYREWTTFEMGLREAGPMPSIFDFVKFLTSSITFMAHLETVTVSLDGKQLAKVTKDKGAPRELPIPKNLRNISDGRIMSVTSINATSFNISVELLRLVYTAGSERKSPPRIENRISKAPAHTGFFSSLFSSLGASSPVIPRTPSPLPPPELEPPDPTSPVTSHVVLSVFSGQVEVRLDKKMINELHRSTKKNPPTKMRLDLIYTGKDEYDASKKDEEGVSNAPGSIFQGLRADLDGTGSARVYIGHATGQTTGIGGHISGRFIPTVERESIDLVDRNVAIWNKELLYVAGFLSRVAYEIEMGNIRNLWNGASESLGGIQKTPEPDLRNWLQDRSLHALKFFTHHPSTPSHVVSNLLEAAFFNSSFDKSFPMISTAGVMDARNIRAYNPEYSGFLQQLPVLPPDVASGAKLMVNALQSRGMVKDVTFADVLTELRARALTQQEMVECLKWRINLNTDGIRPAYLAELRREFLEAAIFTTPGKNDEEKVVPLATIKTVLIPRNATSSIPTDGPFPMHTLPFSVSKQLKSEALLQLFGWSELTVPAWVENLVSPNVQNDPELDITTSAVWAEKVLNVLARAWASLPKEHQSQIVALLKTKTCIPTKFGMKQPEEAYFANANVFSDLPIVTLPKNTLIRGSLEKVLTALGVLQHVNLQIVFDRMIRTGDWGIPELIRYLVAVENNLTSLEMNRLRETVAFTKEEPEQRGEELAPTSDVSSPLKPRKNRFKAMDLYEPSNALRELGLPIIAWGDSPRWRASSDEAKFLFKLGLRRQPNLTELLSLAAGSDVRLRRSALKYFLDNVSSKYPEYDPSLFSNIPYIPAVKPDGTSIMGKPEEVFTDKAAGVMGFLVVDSSITQESLPKLKLPKSPLPTLLLPKLEKSPTRDMATARRWFEYLATRLPDFSSSELHRLSTTAFIPVSSKPAGPTNSSPTLRLLDPQKCYLGGDSSVGFHSQLFTFVDFGSRANGFLMACGVRSEPTVDELAKILVADPRNFYNLAGGLNKFLAELRNIAINYRGIATSTRNQMKKSACLVGSRRTHVSRASIEKRRKKVDDFSDEDEGQLEHDLLPADKIVIVDDTATYSLFDTVFSAPQEDILEEFYAALGSARLSSLVREDYKPSAEILNSTRALETRNLVLERLPLFLHERTHSKPLVSYTWLNNHDNFLVSEVGKLTLIRTLQFGATRMVKSQEASATADRKGKGPVRLYIGGNSQVDLYEVSNSLCRVLLTSHKPNDSLLFMTILSTDLRALRRRGFNIDRILRQQQADRDALVTHDQKLISETKRNSEGDSQQGPTNSPPKDGFLSRPGSGFLSNWRQKLHKPLTPNAFQPSISPPPRPPSPSSKPKQNGTGGVPDPMNPYGKVSSWNADQAVTPHENIERNVRSAIEGCRPEQNSTVRSNAQATRIREAMDEGYCDTIGAIDLELVGYFDGLFKVFVAGKKNDAQSILESKKLVINRFGDLVLQPLINLYNIPSTSCNIFYDFQGPLIAFNRNGSLFLNLRYYEAWHDQDVQKGDLSQAHISWYFSLAHEIAHNLVHAHNSEHEFYFSTICEQHMVKLAGLLGQFHG